MSSGEYSNENKTNKYVERKKRKNRYAKLNGGRWRFIYIKDWLPGEKKSRKSKQRDKCRENIIGLEKLKAKL